MIRDTIEACWWRTSFRWLPDQNFNLEWEEEESLLSRGAPESRDIDQPTPPLPCVCCQLEQKLYTQNIGRRHDGEICMQSNSARRGLNGRMKGGGRNERVRTRVGTTQTSWLNKKSYFIRRNPQLEYIIVPHCFDSQHWIFETCSTSKWMQGNLLDLGGFGRMTRGHILA